MAYKWGLLTTYKSWDDPPIKNHGTSKLATFEILKKDTSNTKVHPSFQKFVRFMDSANRSGQFITTSAEVTLNGGLIRELPQNPLNSALGIILICPDRCVFPNGVAFVRGGCIMFQSIPKYSMGLVYLYLDLVNFYGSFAHPTFLIPLESSSKEPLQSPDVRLSSCGFAGSSPRLFAQS